MSEINKLKEWGYDVLEDDHIMPWGKFRYKKLEEVPAWYLFYMEPKLDRSVRFNRSLLMYIEENRDVLDKESKYN